ncbi:MAG: T9SS type A sorting domain-containing protein [Lewinellaceae bacterium]|nr:T9SS type A sorting domain-containing protein [Lewinellaceae bacterium]
MKKHLFFLVLAIVMAAVTGLYSQSGCLPDGITFSSQAQIDSFPINYPGCSVIEGSVIVQESIDENIISLDSLYSIISIKGDLKIGSSSMKSNFALTSLSGLKDLTTINGSLFVQGNPSLTNLIGLDNVTFLGDDLIIIGNESLTNLTGLNNVLYINGILYVVGNKALTSLDGLDNLTSIGGSISIGGNTILTNLSGLGNVTFVGGLLTIATGNKSLKNLSGLNNVTSIGGLNLNYTSLTSLNGLDNLISIKDDIRIGGNHMLTSLSGLESLTFVGGSIIIGYGEEDGSKSANPMLMSLNGLDNLDYTTPGYLQINYNSKLTTCNILPICDYLANGGKADIAKNAPGCNSQQEVKDACAVSVDSLMHNDAIQLFPNPTTGILKINTPDNTEWSVSLLDANGRLMILSHKLTNGEIDLSNVPTGLYFIELNNGQRSITERIIKQ